MADLFETPMIEYESITNKMHLQYLIMSYENEACATASALSVAIILKSHGKR